MPSILEDKCNEWFNLSLKSPYMLLVSDVNEKKQIKMTKSEEELFGIEKLNIERSSIPAVTHVDYSARIQTVNKNINRLYYKLIEAFEKKLIVHYS